MSRFYATTEGERGTTSKCGHKFIESHTRGWFSGIKVKGYINDDGQDEFQVFLSSGSNGFNDDKYIGTYTKEDL